MTVGSHTKENVTYLASYRVHVPYATYMLKTRKLLYCLNFPKVTGMHHRFYDNFIRIQLTERPLER